MRRVFELRRFRERLVQQFGTRTRARSFFSGQRARRPVGDPGCRERQRRRERGEQKPSYPAATHSLDPLIHNLNRRERPYQGTSRGERWIRPSDRLDRRRALPSRRSSRPADLRVPFYVVTLRGLLAGALTAIGATAIVAACGSSTPSGAATTAGPARAGRIDLQRIGDFSQPVYLAAAPGDAHRLFVVERAGRIIVLVRGRRQGRPFLDISSQVNSGGEEQGLLSMAFAPDYQTSGRFYLYYSDGSNNVQIVQYRRLRNDPNLANPASARTVLTIDHHAATNHNGGQLQFGPDRDLYIGVGDGGNEGDPHNYGQNTGVLLGKLLRIAPRPSGGYTIPRGNP